MSDFYVAIFEQNSEGEYFVTVPDLPGVNVAAKSRSEALRLAIDFANDYVRDLVSDGHSVPTARDIDQVEHDPDVEEVGRALIPIEVPGKTVKISLSIDEALLKRADRAAEEEGLTRSGYFAAAITNQLRMLRPVPAAFAGGSMQLHGHVRPEEHAGKVFISGQGFTKHLVEWLGQNKVMVQISDEDDDHVAMGAVRSKESPPQESDVRVVRPSRARNLIVPKRRRHLDI